MLTLSYTFEKPVTGDKGSVFFPALERNIQKLNDHTHNGSNSSKLTSVAVVAPSSSVAAASWGVDLGDGQYRQSITVPSGVVFYEQGMQCYNSDTGEICYLKIVKITTTTFYVYVNDNSLNLKIIYT